MGYSRKRIAKQKVDATYKSSYISQELVDKIVTLAAESNSSFNAVVISMIEYCLDDMEEEKQ